MSQHVLITGTGRPYALGFNLVKRYLEHGDSVFASVRRPSEALEELKRDYPDRLHILTMDIASTESVNAAAREAERLTDRLDLIVNNATTASADTFYLDYGTEKAALNMLTKTLHNYFKNDPNLNILCVHPGWIRTNPGNSEAPLDPYEHAETLRLLFEARRHDKTGPIFITHTGEAYSW